MNTNKLIVIVVAVVALGALGYFLLKNQSANQANPTVPSPQTQTSQASETPSPEASSSPSSQVQANTIEYSSSGFNPKTITVKAGTTVTWVNKDSDKLWVASNPHPIHTDLPGFDAKKGISTGESYSYTFTKVGTWGYHNHLEPGNKGEVVVE